MKIQKLNNGDQVTFFSEGRGDNDYLKTMVEYVTVREALFLRIKMLGERLSNTQTKMHESTAISADLKKELFRIKRSWVYRVLEFIKGNKNGYIQIYK